MSSHNLFQKECKRCVQNLRVTDTLITDTIISKDLVIDSEDCGPTNVDINGSLKVCTLKTQNISSCDPTQPIRINSNVIFNGTTNIPGIPGPQGPQGIPGIGIPGPQGPQGLQELDVEHTAFVDNVFGTIAGVVQDETKPFLTIAGAIAAVIAARPLPTERWQIVIRPGTFTENITLTSPNLYITGAGDSTIINGTVTQAVGAGPSEISNVYVNVPSTSNVVIQDALTIRDSKWFFTPASSAVGDVFRLTGVGVPFLNMYNSYISILPGSPATTGTGFFQLTNMQGTAATLVVRNVIGIQSGLAAGVMGYNSISGVITISIRDSSFDLTVYDTGSSGTIDFMYGGFGAIARGGPVPNDIIWTVDNCSHIIRNGTGTANISPYVIAVQTGFGFVPQPTSRFVIRDSSFDFVNYPSASVVYSATDMSTPGGFITFLDDKWSGLTLSNSTTYVPYQDTVPPFVSNRIIYEALSSNGSVISRGGLQTGTNVLPAGSITYTVNDSDTIIVWAPSNAATLNLPNTTTTIPAGPVYIGKWIVVHNSNTSGFSITINSLGSANGTVVLPGRAVIFITYDGSNWFTITGP